MKIDKTRPTTTVRFSLFILFTVLFVILLISRFFHVMVLDTNETSSRETHKAENVERGPILDRSGRILAIQTRLYSVTAWLPNVEDPRKTADLLAPILGMDAPQLYSRLKEETGFLYIRRKVSPSVSEKIRTHLDNGELPGISLEAEYGRNYPNKDLASHVLGFVGTDNLGLDGIELTYEQTLSPDATEGMETRYGNQLFLTLDLNIQYMAEDIAEGAFAEHDADAVTVLVMDAKSGEFLAWASAPDFDPNRFADADKEMKSNRPLTFAYEPGSVFKAFSIASLMELGGITPDSTFFCDGAYERDFSDDRQVVINCLGRHGEVRAKEILKYSCNAGAAYASETVSKSDFHQKLTDFGFGSPSHLPLPGETAGLLREPEKWSGRTKPTIAIGQEISVSALQIISAATAFTNDGVMLQPHIVKKIVSSEGKIIEAKEREPFNRVLRPEIAKAILYMMESGTERSGTAWRAKIPKVRTSAKTGTAEKIDVRTGSYSKEVFVASCLGIFPTDDPRLIIYIAIDYPKKGEYLGGRIAAPLVGELGERLVTYLGIPTSEETVVHHSGVIRLPDIPEIEIGKALPDFYGLPKRRLLPLLHIEEIDVFFEGEGWVKSQSPPPGSEIRRDMKIRLEFE